LSGKGLTAGHVLSFGELIAAGDLVMGLDISGGGVRPEIGEVLTSSSLSVSTTT
jgi:hypothetical protein